MKIVFRTGALACGAVIFGGLLASGCAQPANNENASATKNTSATTGANANVAAPANANAAAATTAKVSEGEEIFSVNCASCHEADGSGKPQLKSQDIPDFTNAAWQARETDAELVNAIRNGKGKLMPAWKGKLSDAEITAVLAHVRSLAKDGPGAEGKTPEKMQMPKS